VEFLRFEQDMQSDVMSDDCQESEVSDTRDDDCDSEEVSSGRIVARAFTPKRCPALSAAKVARIHEARLFKTYWRFCLCECGALRTRQ
jgi:hypothetical protein